MSERPGTARSARGDAEIIISPDGDVMIFDLDPKLLTAAEALNPADPRVRAARRSLGSQPADGAEGESQSGSTSCT